MLLELLEVLRQLISKGQTPSPAPSPTPPPAPAPTPEVPPEPAATPAPTPVPAQTPEAPTIELTDATTNPPKWRLTLPGEGTTDGIDIEWNYTGQFSGTPTESHTITDADVESDLTFSTFTNLDPGTVHWQVREVVDGVPGPWSNPLSCTIAAPSDTGGGIVLPLKVVVDGDSVSADPGSVMNRWAAANPTIAFENFAEGGSGIPQVVSRVAKVLAANPSHVGLVIGTNDLVTAPDADTWLAGLKGVVGQYKAGRPGLGVLVSTVLPCSYPGHNERRAYVNPLIWAGAGVWHDGVIPLGDHPDIGADNAPFDLRFYKDGLHPNAAGQVASLPSFTAALNGALGLPFPHFVAIDNANATVSEVYVSDAVVSGLAPTASTLASLTGAGTFSAGLSAATSASKRVVNGDVCRRYLTASDAPEATVTQTLTINGYSDEWDLTTQAALPAITWTGSPCVLNAATGAGYSGEFPGVQLAAGTAILKTNSASAVTVGGAPATHVATLGGFDVWSYEVPTAGQFDVAVTYTTYADATNQWLLAGNISNANVSSAADGGGKYLGFSYGPWALDQTTIIPANGIAIAFLWYGPSDIGFSPKTSNSNLAVVSSRARGTATFTDPGTLTGSSPANNQSDFLCTVVIFAHS